MSRGGIEKECYDLIVSGAGANEILPLLNRCDPHWTNRADQRRTLLHAAAANGNTPRIVIERLFQIGPQLSEARDDEDLTPLHVAIRTGPSEAAFAVADAASNEAGRRRRECAGLAREVSALRNGRRTGAAAAGDGGGGGGGGGGGAAAHGRRSGSGADGGGHGGEPSGSGVVGFETSGLADDDSEVNSLASSMQAGPPSSKGGAVAGRRAGAAGRGSGHGQGGSGAHGGAAAGGSRVTRPTASTNARQAPGRNAGPGSSGSGAQRLATLPGDSQLLQPRALPANSRLGRKRVEALAKIRNDARRLFDTEVTASAMRQVRLLDDPPTPVFRLIDALCFIVRATPPRTWPECQQLLKQGGFREALRTADVSGYTVAQMQQLKQCVGPLEMLLNKEKLPPSVYAVCRWVVTFEKGTTYVLTHPISEEN